MSKKLFTESIAGRIARLIFGGKAKRLQKIANKDPELKKVMVDLEAAGKKLDDLMKKRKI